MLDRLKRDIKKLSPGELQKLRKYVNYIAPPSVSYQKRGAYWYAFFRYGREVHTVYVGKEKKGIDPFAELEKKKSTKRR